MTDEAASEKQDEPEAPAGRAWQPSRRAAHFGESDGNPVRVDERRAAAFSPRALLQRLNQPAVKIVIGLALFVGGAVALESLLDSDWAQREVQEKPTKHAPGSWRPAG